ncbi:MAG TPA: hypothetical protein VG370_21295 [Chloroflexota bacterium]|nr:hypothetical protein [Chloroflexota bacterium]
MALLVLWPTVGRAHDAGSWGGLFRSVDDGATWFPANQGTFVGGALALAVSPTDSMRLLLATDSGLLASRNGGRDWQAVQSDPLVGPVFAVALDADGQRALAATGRDLVRSDDGATWRRVPSPAGATPVGAIVPGGPVGRVYLVGWRGLFVSHDWGGAWSAVGSGLPDLPPAALLVARAPPETLYALLGGQVWASSGETGAWSPRQAGLPIGRVGALALDPLDGATPWAGASAQLYRGDDRGASWRPIGQPLPEPRAEIRSIAFDANGFAVALATDRGLYRSRDRGGSWELLSDNLPAHLEAGLLVRDPAEPTTLYAGFSLTPYGELRQAAARDRSTVAGVAAGELAGALALLGALVLGAAFALRRLGRREMLARESAR